MDVFGGSLALGEVSGDGTVDLIVGAAGADGPGKARSDAGEAYVFFGGQGLFCLPRPERTTGLRAVRRGPNVEVQWDPAADTATERYDVWAVENGDKTFVPYANLASQGPDLTSPCPPPPAATPVCTDAGAISRAPTLIFYQVRAACANGTENIDHPF